MYMQVFQLAGTSEPLGVMISSALFHLGNLDSAIQYAHTSVVAFKNPMRVALAFRKVGALAIRIGGYRKNPHSHAGSFCKN